MPTDDLHPDIGVLHERVEALERDVATIAEAYVKLTSQRDPSRVRSYLQEDDEESARLTLEDLAGWAAAVWVQYPDGQLPECWLYHPPIIEELVAVMGAHRACFRKGGTWSQFADWHARLRPSAAERIRRYAPSCTLDLHQPGEQFDPAAVTSVPRLQDISQVAAQWTETGTSPYPTSTPI